VVENSEGSVRTREIIKLPCENDKMVAKLKDKFIPKYYQLNFSRKF
jgi:hypothetical protein